MKNAAQVTRFISNAALNIKVELNEQLSSAVKIAEALNAAGGEIGKTSIQRLLKGEAKEVKGYIIEEIAAAAQVEPKKAEPKKAVKAAEPKKEEAASKRNASETFTVRLTAAGEAAIEKRRGAFKQILELVKEGVNTYAMIYEALQTREGLRADWPKSEVAVQVGRACQEGLAEKIDNETGKVIAVKPITKK